MTDEKQDPPEVEELTSDAKGSKQLGFDTVKNGASQLKEKFNDLPKVAKILIPTVAAVVLFSCCCCSCFSVFWPIFSGGDGGGSGSIANVEPDLTVSAKKLFDDYKANEAATDDMYKNKIIVVSGSVHSVEKSWGSVNVKLKEGDNQFSIGFVSCALAKSSVAMSKTLQPGDRVRIKGKCKGGQFVVQLENCSILE